MSLYESQESNGTVSLKDLFHGKHDLESEASFSIEQYAFAICRGGWPATLHLSPKHALKTAVNYVEAVAAAVMRATPEKILEDFKFFGFLFEALCTRDMRIYAQANDGSVFHYRDKSGLESDMIVALNDGRWGAIEVKLGRTQIEEAAANLLVLKEKINLEKMGEPAFLLVLTGGQYAYKRPDGVLVVPLACMKH